MPRALVPLLMDECVWILPGATRAATEVIKEKPEQVAAKIKAAADGVGDKVEIERFLDAHGRWRPQRHVHGILGIHVDDLIGGGDVVFDRAITELKKRLEALSQKGNER